MGFRGLVHKKLLSVFQKARGTFCVNATSNVSEMCPFLTTSVTYTEQALYDFLKKNMDNINICQNKYIQCSLLLRRESKTAQVSLFYLGIPFAYQHGCHNTNVHV